MRLVVTALSALVLATAACTHDSYLKESPAQIRQQQVTADVSGLPVHARSGAWMASANAASTHLHPDFGSSGDPSAPYGIPWTAVPGSHAKVTPAFDYADESDPGPYPFGPETPIEGGQQS